MTKPDDNLYSCFAEHFPADRESTLLETPDGRRFSYAQAVEESGRLASYFSGLGLEPGDRITVQVQKSPEALWLYLACLRTGLVFHPLNDAYLQDEIAYFLADAEPALAVCDPAQETTFKRLAAKLDCRVLTLDASGTGSLRGQSRASSPDFETVMRDRDDLAVLLYSSGTTGEPKGAMLTHGNLASNCRTLVDAWGFTPEDRLLHALPIYHAHGLFVATGCVLMSGASMLFLPHFDAQTVVEMLPRCSLMMGVPTFYTRLLATRELSPALCANLRLFVSGSAPLLPETFDEFERRSGHAILERYGMTETGMNTSNPLHGERRAGSVGMALPGVGVRVVNDDGNPLPPDEIGNLQVSGPNVFAGYWRMQEKTAAEFTSDGWFNTGDQAALSADGYVSILGRSKDMIITGGLNVYPREVEKVIDTLDGVQESTVVGIAHPDFGEGVVAVIVAMPDHWLEEAAIVETLRGRLAAFKLPKRVFFVSELPRNALGKVQKAALREELAKTFGPAEARRP